MKTTSQMVELCKVDDVSEGEVHRGTLPCGHALAIYRVEGELYVTDDICSHGEASLSEDGELDGYEIECSWHFGRFDIRNGEACAMPCERAIRSWPVKVEDGRVFVDAGAFDL